MSNAVGALSVKHSFRARANNGCMTKQLRRRLYWIGLAFVMIATIAVEPVVAAWKPGLLFEELVVGSDFIGIVRSESEGDPSNYLVVESWKGGSAGSTVRLRLISLRLAARDEYLVFAKREAGENCPAAACYFVHGPQSYLRISPPVPKVKSYFQLSSATGEELKRYNTEAKDLKELKAKVLELAGASVDVQERRLLIGRLTREYHATDVDSFDRPFPPDPDAGKIARAIDSTSRCDELVQKLLLEVASLEDLEASSSPPDDRISETLANSGIACVYDGLRKFASEEKAAKIPARLKWMTEASYRRLVGEWKVQPIDWRTEAEPSEPSIQPKESTPPDGSPEVIGRQAEAIRCRFDRAILPPGSVVLGASGTATPLGFQIDQSGYDGMRVDVTVNFPAAPVALILAAYEPTVWNISWTKETRIAAVLATGYHRQVLAGLPRETPQFSSSFAEGQPCGSVYDLRGEEGKKALTPISQALFGQKVRAIFDSSFQPFIVGDPPSADAAIVTSNDRTVDSYHDPAAPLAGPAGLKAAFQRGDLRLATSKEKLHALEVIGKVPSESSCTNRLSWTETVYVIEKPFTFPAGLFGGSSAMFLLPEGAPEPQGNRGHSTIVDLGKRKCIDL